MLYYIYRFLNETYFCQIHGNRSCWSICSYQQSSFKIDYLLLISLPLDCKEINFEIVTYSKLVLLLIFSFSRSLLDLSDTSIDQKDLNTLIDTMYTSAGLSPAEKIGFESFKKIFASDEYGSTLQNATLNIASK